MYDDTLHYILIVPHQLPLYILLFSMRLYDLVSSFCDDTQLHSAGVPISLADGNSLVMVTDLCFCSHDIFY